MNHSTLPSLTRRTLAACLPLAAALSFYTLPARAQDTSGGCKRNPEVVSCREDATTQSDRQQLQRMVDGMFAPFSDEDFGPADVQLRFVGKIRTVPESEFPGNEPQERASGGGTNPHAREVGMFRAINPGTGNEFEIEVPRNIRDAFDRLMISSGANHESRGLLRLPDSRETRPPTAPQSRRGGGASTNAWSGGNDSRVTVADPAGSFPWVAVANIGRCTATFVGPRHLVTAAHCLYNRTSASFSSLYTIQPGRDSANVPYQTTIPGPGNAGSWLFVPPQYMQASPAGGVDQYDIGIMVTPDRLADQFGWLGYGTLSSGSMRNRTHLVRGYPLCESETGTPTPTATNPERIDEPVSCVINDFFAGDPCSVGTFSVQDGDGWSRRVTHGCDASAGNSGSSVYSYVDGFGAFVSMVHTRSLKCAFAGNAACTASDTFPLEATRITPEYSGWLSWYRNMWQ